MMVYVLGQPVFVSGRYLTAIQKGRVAIGKGNEQTQISVYMYVLCVDGGSCTSESQTQIHVIGRRVQVQSIDPS